MNYRQKLLLFIKMKLIPINTYLELKPLIQKTSKVNFAPGGILI